MTPQEPFAPRPFQAGRKPSRLAYVLNRSEARKLGSNDNEEEAAKRIASDCGANVVIVKRGALGALILENGQISTVPAFKRAWYGRLGPAMYLRQSLPRSGEFIMPPRQVTAVSASRATAEYVENRVLPIQKSMIENTMSRQPIELGSQTASPRRV